MNAIITAYKPALVGSNHFLGRLKRKYQTKKAGFSGTLDPFAKGCLVVAFGNYTKLLPYLSLAPKTYIATLWLGAFSESLDIERIYSVDVVPQFNKNEIEIIINNLQQLKKITPPKFSAKWVNGKRAYELARDNKDFELKEMDIDIFSSKLILYNHPFVTFEVSVSKGTYVRSLAKIVADSLNVNGALSALERISEGKLYFKNYKPEVLNEILNLNKNRCFKDEDFIKNGKKLSKDDFENSNNGDYFCEFESFFSIIRIDENGVSYLLNTIGKE